MTVSRILLAGLIAALGTLNTALAATQPKGDEAKTPVMPQSKAASMPAVVPAPDFPKSVSLSRETNFYRGLNDEKALAKLGSKTAVMVMNRTEGGYVVQATIDGKPTMGFVKQADLQMK